MALTSCRECGKEVSTEAQACPHCGAVSPAGSSTPPPPTSPSAPAPKKSSANVPGCLILIAVIVVLVLIGSIGNRAKEAAKTPEQRAQEARARQEREEILNTQFACYEAVKRRLKAPTTAQFSEVLASVSTKDPTKIVVVGKVTAENSFGAHITNSFGCELNRVSKTWTQIVVE